MITSELIESIPCPKCTSTNVRYYEGCGDFECCGLDDYICYDCNFYLAGHDLGYLDTVQEVEVYLKESLLND